MSAKNIKAEALPLESRPTIMEKWCNTKSRFTKHIYTWAIDDFRANIMAADSELLSTMFDEEFPRKLQWQLKISRTNSDRDLYFQVLLLKGDGSPIHAVLEFSILNPNGSKDHIAVKNSTNSNNNYQTVSFLYDRESMFGNTKQLIYDDRLTVRFVISMRNSVVLTSESIPNRCGASFKLSDDLGRLLESETFSDIKLTVAAETFPVHKAVLAARSDVFAAMFQHDMLESSKNQVKITDIKSEVFRETLQFIYTGKLRNERILKDMALEILAVADKYVLEELKDLCEQYLMQNISSKTVADTLIVAELHSAKRLKDRAINFIKGNMAEVALTSGWFKIGAIPHLMEEFSAKN